MTRLIELAKNIAFYWGATIISMMFLVAAIWLTVLFGGIIYYGGKSILTGDIAHLEEFLSSSEDSVSDELARVSDLDAGNLQDAISRLRERLEIQIEQHPSSSQDDEVLLERVTALEQMLTLKPEEVVTVAVQAQRLTAIENSLLSLEGRIQSQISNLYTLVIGLFGALLVAVVGAAILQSYNTRKSAP